MKKSTSFPSQLLEANTGINPSNQPPQSTPQVSPEFQQELEVLRETVCF